MEFLEVPLYDDDILKLCIRFALNVLFLLLIVRYAIYPSQRDREFLFTAVMMNVTVFFICFALKKLELELGMALGLFAIFGVLRYRTDAIRAKDMTYLFIVVGLAVINSLSNKKTSYAELVAVNLFIIGASVLLERIVSRLADKSAAKTLTAKTSDAPAKEKKLRKTTVEYDKLEMLAPEQRDSLVADLTARTGISIARVQVQAIDLKKNTAILTIQYSESL